VVVLNQKVVGRIEFDPAGFAAAPAAHPGMHRVCAGQNAVLPAGGIVRKKPADISRRHAEAAETGDQ